MAPNVFGSPSWGTYQTNSINALLSGAYSMGTPNTPGYYQQRSNVTSNDLIVTGFPSWEGQVDPGTAFDPAYANEYGNRGHFGVVIDGNGQQISIDQLSFTAASNDPGNLLAELMRRKKYEK